MKTKMDRKFELKGKFDFEGKEYDSFEDMPAEAREAFWKAKSESAGEEAGPNRTKIKHEGKEYDLEELPPHVQEIFKNLQRRFKKEPGVIEPSSGSEIGDIPEPGADFHTGDLPTEPIAPKAFSASFWFRIVLLLIAIGMIYEIISQLRAASWLGTD
ncbi:MAG: hypothetical protein NT056_08180 [Proteobacteria bacterium]|nr:hypothetical protein [Pseudomonadota bacterium]